MSTSRADLLNRAKALPALSVADLATLTDFLHARTGMRFGEAKRYYIDRRVADRMAQRHLTSFADYQALLRTEPSEVEQLINSFTVNETYFYREEHQLSCLSQSILPEIIQSKEPGEKIRIWSVPCSSGEEPYSIAIWLLENWALVDAFNVEIVGSDIDTEIVAEALEADYGSRAVMRLPPELIQRYFLPSEDGRVRLIADLRESVIFTPCNITDAASVARQGRFDVIFCRNLLIYFDAIARVRCVENLFTSLLPGGYVCLGHSESMSRISERFITRRFPQAIVYQRPEVT
ncbi:CheR family methyltransferase [Devosia sp. RR2S18]|uniref:CheR family methyltransferase n=1 Tax=Devosia rhizosphaerae TaxID=3049774 RepID=UPI0025412E46|nr:protein-glutamate O-methyltransferase CheR [Devosia sp. RR2S18]WIJ25841.1 protein-glutamate O-methyltransferase CheR [Devosia sp. RR2S18]